MNLKAEMKTLNDLNEYIIQEIFDYLDEENLKQCSLVCKLWDEIISNHSSTMNKIPFVLHGSITSAKETERVQRISQSTRKIHRLSVQDATVSSNVIEKVKSISQHVHILEVSSTKFENVSHFYDFLRCFEKLEKLLLFETRIIEKTNSLQEPENFPMNLKTLILSNQDDGLFGPLTKLGLQSQKIIIDCDRYRESGEGYINPISDFLSQQKTLHSLAIKTYGKKQQSNLFKKLAQEIKSMEVRKLAVTMRIFANQIWEADDFTHLIEFMTIFKKSLTDLELDCVLLPSSIFKLLAGEMKVEKLTITTHDMPTNLIFKPGTRNIHLKSLICHQKLPNQTAILLFKAFPAITYLVLNDGDSGTNENLIAISQHLKSLKHLKISDLTVRAPEVVIPTLKFLQVNFVMEATEERLTFINVNPSIEILMFKWSSHSFGWNFEQVNSLTRNLVNLKRLVFGPCNIEVHSRMLEMLNRNCTKLTSVEIFKTSDESSSEVNVKLGNVSVTHYERLVSEFIFKDEVSIWFEDKEFEIELILSDNDEDHNSLDFGDLDDDYDDYDDDDSYDGNEYDDEYDDLDFHHQDGFLDGVFMLG